MKSRQLYVATFLYMIVVFILAARFDALVYFG